MRRFMKIFAFLMLGLGLAAAPGYWTYVNFLSASTVAEQFIFDGDNSAGRAEAGGELSVYLAPDMNPIQILGRLDVVPPEAALPGSRPAGGPSNLHVAVRSGDQQIWAAAATLLPNFSSARGDATPAVIGVNLGRLYVYAPGDYFISGRVDHTDRFQVQRIHLEVRRGAIDIRWGLFGLGVFLILGAIILYRIAES